MKYPPGTLIPRTGIGKDSRRFLRIPSTKPCILAGVIFEDVPGLDADSDGDVVYQAICNAISSLIEVPLLGLIADELSTKGGITDSQVYLHEALKLLHNQMITHVSISIEGKRPELESKLMILRQSIAASMHLKLSQVGVTAISGEGLSDVGCGEGIACTALITTIESV